MRYPKADCDGDCFHCPLPDCQSGNYPPYRPTPFEREQIAIQRDKARRTRQEAKHRLQVERAFRAWRRRNGIGRYRTGGRNKP